MQRDQERNLRRMMDLHDLPADVIREVEKVEAWASRNRHGNRCQLRSETLAQILVNLGHVPPVPPSKKPKTLAEIPTGPAMILFSEMDKRKTDKEGEVIGADGKGQFLVVVNGEKEPQHINPKHVKMLGATVANG